MRTGRLCLLVALAVGCGKKDVATQVADAAPEVAPASCLHARNARAYVWREEPLELALDAELDWTCRALADEQLELTDTDMGAKLGERKKEGYRLDEDGALAEYDDPFLVGPPRVHGLFVYSVPRLPGAVGLRYGGVQILQHIPVVTERPKRPPPPSAMRIVATSSEPGKEKGTNRLTVLIALDDVPRSAGRNWKVGGTTLERAFFFEMTGDAHGGTIDAEWVDADHVLDVDEDLVPIETPVASLPVRPSNRYVLAEVSATRMKRVDTVSLSTGESRLKANAKSVVKLILAKETRARLDAAVASVDVAAAKARP